MVWAGKLVLTKLVRKIKLKAQASKTSLTASPGFWEVLCFFSQPFFAMLQYEPLKKEFEPSKVVVMTEKYMGIITEITVRQ